MKIAEIAIIIYFVIVICMFLGVIQAIRKIDWTK